MDPFPSGCNWGGGGGGGEIGTKHKKYMNKLCFHVTFIHESITR